MLTSFKCGKSCKTSDRYLQPKLQPLILITFINSDDDLSSVTMALIPDFIIGFPGIFTSFKNRQLLNKSCRYDDRLKLKPQSVRLLIFKHLYEDLSPITIPRSPCFIFGLNEIFTSFKCEQLLNKSRKLSQRF